MCRSTVRLFILQLTFLTTMSLLGKQKQQQALEKSLLGRPMWVTTLSLLGKQKQQQALR